jgi:hypothetical protein
MARIHLVRGGQQYCNALLLVKSRSYFLTEFSDIAREIGRVDVALEICGYSLRYTQTGGIRIPEGRQPGDFGCATHCR